MMPSSLRARGRVVSSDATSSLVAIPSSSISIDYGENNDNDGISNNNNNSRNHHGEYHEAARKALQSMQFCYRMCFIFVLTDLIATLLLDDDDDGNAAGGGNSSTTKLQLKKNSIDCISTFIQSNISTLIFGGGIWYMTRIYHTSYWKATSDFDKRMSQENLIRLFQMKAWVWGVLTLNVMLATVSLAVSLPDIFATFARDENGLFSSRFKNTTVQITGRQSSLVAILVIGMGSLITRHKCGKIARREYLSYKERNHRIDELYLRPRLDVIRASGFRAYVNQSCCATSFGILGMLELVKWIATLPAYNNNGFYWNNAYHMTYVYDFITPFIVSWLLFVLSKAMVPAFIAEVLGDPTKVDHHEKVYQDLFVAGMGFYSKVGETLKSATIFRLLPFAASLILKCVLAISERIFLRNK